MQAKFIRFVGVLLILLATGSVSANQVTHWQPTLDGAKRVANQSGRLVLVHFWAPWCQACKTMEQNVFGQPEIANSIESNCVPVRLNFDHFPATAKQFGVTSLPTSIIMTPDGQSVGKIEGALLGSQYSMQVGKLVTNARVRNRTPLAQIPDRAANVTPSSRVNQPPQQTAVQQPVHASQGSKPSDDRYAAYYARRRASALANVSPQYQRQVPTASQAAMTNRYGQEASSQATNRRHESGLSATQPKPKTNMALGDSQPPANTPQNAANPPLGLEGYCPVQLTEKQRWMLGNRRWGAIHRGRTYLFAGPDEQRRFLAAPDRYSPIFCGNDVVEAIDGGQTVSGYRKHGVFFGGRVYLFSNEASLEKFSKDPNRYANATLQSLRAAINQTIQ